MSDLGVPIDPRCGSQGLDADGHCFRCGLVPDLDSVDDCHCPPGFLAPIPGLGEPFSYWARVIDDAVGYLAKCENDHSGPRMMPLTVTLTAIAMHLRGMAAAPHSPERAKAHSLLDELIDALPNVAESTHVFAQPGDGASNYAFERCKQIRVVALAAAREEAKRG